MLGVFLFWTGLSQFPNKSALPTVCRKTNCVDLGGNAERCGNMLYCIAYEDAGAYIDERPAMRVKNFGRI